MMNTLLPRAARAALEFEEKVLPNGLVLRVLAMPEYGSVHVIYATAFGAINRGFEYAGKVTNLPAGVAHFLEHKMFENEDGTDAFALFGETGAAANAYTGFDRTSYIFTATSQIERNLDILLSFVGSPHFTEKTVAKEQGIIGQEIKMYVDEADLRCYFAMLECLYHNHPVRDEIVGTVESISLITPDMLYGCCDAFYNSGNMALCAAGNITMQQLEDAVTRAGMTGEKPQPTRRIFKQEPAHLACARREFEMAVAMPQFAIGFKEAVVGGDTLKTEVVCDMLAELICGETSPLYRRLYDEGMVQPGFSGEVGCFDECLYFGFTGEGPDPDRVKQELLLEIARQRRDGIDEEQFETCRRMMYGESISDLESVERVAGLLSATHFKGRTPAQELAVVAALSVQDVNEALQHVLSEERCVIAIVRPKAE